MNKLGIVGTPQVGDFISIIQNNGDKIEGQVINWGAENWDQYWATIKADDQYLQINISSVSKYYLKKPTAAIAIVNKKTNESKIIKAGGVETEPIITRRVAEQQSSFKEEANGANSHLSMNPVERARFQASQYQNRIESDRQAAHKQMTRQSVEKVKNNYAVPSFKKRT